MNSIISWVGGKKALRDLIYQRMPVSYDRYIEVFGGGGWVLFGKPPDKCMEVYNDFNSNLANLFYCVKERPMALLKELSFLPLNSRDGVHGYGAEKGIHHHGGAGGRKHSAFVFFESGLVSYADAHGSRTDHAGHCRHGYICFHRPCDPADKANRVQIVERRQYESDIIFCVSYLYIRTFSAAFGCNAPANP